MMEAYSYSDPTRAEDGLFLNPSETLISNGISGNGNAEADGFAPGEAPSGLTDDYGAFIGGNPPAGEQHSSEDRRSAKVSSPLDEQTQPAEPQTGEDTGFDLEADFDAAFAELDGEQGQEGENQNWDLEADLNAAFDEFLSEVSQVEDLVVDVDEQLDGEQQQDGESQTLNLEADLNAAFDELVSEVSHVEYPVVDDADESFFTPAGDDNEDLDSLFSPDDIDDELLCLDSIKEGERTVAKPASNPESIQPSLSRSIENNGPLIPTQPAWQAAIFGQPSVTQKTGSTPASGMVPSMFIQPESTVLVPLAASCQYLPTTNSLTPAVSFEGLPATSPLPSPVPYQTQPALNSSPCPSIQPVLMPITPVVTGQHQTAQIMRLPLTPSSSSQVAPGGSELSKLCFFPGAPFKRSFTPNVSVEPPIKKAKLPGLPRASEIPAFFQMEKRVLRDFEKLVKAFMLDLKHPQRYADGAANVHTYHKTAVPTITSFSKYPAQFLNEGSGEAFFGAKSDGYATRTLKWPADKDDIAKLVLLLFRKICKNEYQRRYAGRSREKAKESKGQAIPKKNTNKKSMPPPSDVSQSPISSPSPQSLEQSKHPTRTSTPESLSSQSSSPELSVTSTCVQGRVLPLVPHEARTRNGNTPIRPPSQPPSGPPSMTQVNNRQSVSHDCTSTGNRPDSQPFAFTMIPFELPDLQFSVTYVLENRKDIAVRSKVDLAVGVHPSHWSMLHLIHQTIPNDYYLDSLNVQGPSVLRRIQYEDVWNAAVLEISMIPTMGSEVKCVAGLAKKAMTMSTTSREVIVID